jgi:hypothetical protein
MTAPRARAVSRRCLACCTVFEMPPAEVAWFAERGWSLPTHCLDCRRRRRHERRVAEFAAPAATPRSGTRGSR